MRNACLLMATILLGACATGPGHPRGPDLAELKRQVADTERAFARTMADRDHAAFSAFLSQETVFFTGPTPLRGSKAVAERWKRFYEKPAAPFSWEPAEVEVLDSGTLALSSGPVHDPAGRQIGTFTSIWRLEAPGTWRIVFDKGCPPCDCEERKK
jgi:ketosteroid isomerase-like protein